MSIFKSLVWFDPSSNPTIYQNGKRMLKSSVVDQLDINYWRVNRVCIQRDCNLNKASSDCTRGTCLIKWESACHPSKPPRNLATRQYRKQHTILSEIMCPSNTQGHITTRLIGNRAHSWRVYGAVPLRRDTVSYSDTILTLNQPVPHILIYKTEITQYT